MKRPRISEYIKDNLSTLQYAEDLDKYCDRLEYKIEAFNKVFTVVDRAVDYIYTEMQPYTMIGEEVTRWDREYIREWLWDDEEWK